VRQVGHLPRILFVS